MTLRPAGWLLFLTFMPPLCAAAAAERARPEVAALLEDNGEELLPKLTNPTGCPGEGHVDKEEKFSGESSVRIVPMQRFEPAIPGWKFRITENPKPDEFRYLRFAWKSRGCSGIMLQLHDETDWNIRHTAGVDKYGGERNTLPRSRQRNGLSSRSIFSRTLESGRSVGWP